MAPDVLHPSLLRRRGVLSLAVAAGAMATLPQRAAADTLREELPNGLIVLAEERRTAETVAVRLSARAGSRDDGAAPGINAITSRVMFQGTTRRPSETQLQRVAAQVGGTLGRSTSAELSAFSSVMPSRKVDVAFDLLADLALDPLFQESALARQKQLTLQDLERQRTDPEALLAELFQAAQFAGHPVSTPTLGTPETVQAFTREALLAHRASFWTGGNLVLTVVGRIRPQEALEKARRFFGEVPAGPRVERPSLPLGPREAAGTVQGEAGRQQVQFRLGFPVPGLLHGDRYALSVLNTLMAGSSGRFFEEVRNQRGLAYSAGSGFARYTDIGAWFAAAGVDPENLGAALEVVRNEIRRLTEAPPDTDDVANKISQIAGQQILAGEGNAARADQFASQEVLGLEPIEEVVRRIRLVTPDDVLRVAQTYLDLDRALLVVVGPPGLQVPEA